MPTPKPLNPFQAKKTLANRLIGKVDRIRQFSTKFGLRSQRVFLVWTVYSGEERGEGKETEIRRKEILPTPKIAPMNSISFMLSTGGVMPVGALKVSLISASITNDELEGLYVPERSEDRIPDKYRFYYEIVEDGRGDRKPLHQRFRLAAKPWRNEGAVSWEIVLERVSLDPDRDGITPDE